MVTANRTLYRDGALADGRSDVLQVGISIFVDGGRIAWIRPSDGEDDPGPEPFDVVDASGCTFVPGMVDAHSHLTMPGGAHWIERGSDPPERLVAAAEDNARLLRKAGVRWARDVGAPLAVDGHGRRRAASLGVRDAWRAADGTPLDGYPYVRAAGAWVMRTGTLSGISVEAADADELLGAAMGQLDDGADLVKLYLDGPDPAVAPWSVAEVARVVDAAHARAARVTAHAGRLDGARVAAEAGVDSIEHGFELDADIARTMASRGTMLVSTLAVMRSWQSFATTTRLPRFTSPDGRAAIAARRERAGGQRPHRPGCRRRDRGGHRLRWRLAARGSARVGGRVARRRRARAVGGAPCGDRRRRCGPRRTGGRLHPQGGSADFFLVHGDPLSDPAALWRVGASPGGDARAPALSLRCPRPPSGVTVRAARSHRAAATSSGDTISASGADDRNCSRYSVAYAPPRASSSACVPRSTMRPRS
jgi:imidazolonepropionase-like amidohydrolase